MNYKNQKGFTLIEVMVVAGIIAILAGILVPLIFDQVEESKKTRALADAKTYQAAFMKLKSDTGSWPVKSDPATSNGTIITGRGQFPSATLAGLGWDQSVELGTNSTLVENANAAYTNWKGPYISDASADPWGNTYIVNIADFATTNPVWILSAGPNGIYETGVTSPLLQGDDVGLRIK